MFKHKIPVLDNYEWQKAVISTLSTPPDTNNTGDRYIIGANPSGAWHNKPKRIAEFNGESWDITLPKEGMLVLVKSESILYHFINNKWRDFALMVSSKRRVANYTTDHNITLDEAGILFVADSDNDITFTLPSVTASDIGTTYTFAKVRRDSKLIIQANDSDYIADSGAGCTIYTDLQHGIEFATLTLTLIQADRWGIITGNGTWFTTTMEQ